MKLFLFCVLLSALGMLTDCAQVSAAPPLRAAERKPVREYLAACPSELASQLFVSAMAAFDNAEPERAHRILKEAIRRYPQWLDAQLAMARTLYVLCRENDALKVLASAQKNYPLSSQPYALRGNIYLSRAEFFAARDELKSAVLLDPEDADSCLALAQTYLVLGEKDECFHYLHQCLRFAPNLLKARVLLSRLLWQKGDYKSALLEMNAALALDANNPTLLGEQAALLVANGKYASALDKLQQAYKLSPESAELQRQLLCLYAEQKDWASAEDAARSWLQLEPKNIRAKVLLSWCMLMNSEFDESLKEANAALESAPTNAELQNILGIIKTERKKPEEALAQFNKSNECQADFLPAQLNIVQNYLIQSEFDKARELLRSLGISYGQNSAVLSLSAFVQLKSENFHAAAKFAKRALELNASDTLALICQGVVWREAGQLEESEKALEKAGKLDPDNPFPLCELSKTMRLMNKTRSAISLAQQALQLAPQNLDAKEALAMALLQDGNLDGAIFLLKECALRSKNKLPLQLTLASAQMRRGDIYMAENTLKKARQLFPDKPGPLLGLAEFAEKERQYAKAEDFLKEALTYAPVDSELRCRLARAYFLQGKMQLALDEFSTINDAKLDNESKLIKARCHYKCGNYEAAIKTYASSNLNALSSSDRLNYAQALFISGKPDLSMAVLEKIDPSSPSSGNGAKDLRSSFELSRLKARVKKSLLNSQLEEKKHSRIGVSK